MGEARERVEDRWVAAVREGDDEAFELIYRSYRDRISSYVRRLVGDHARAEDITQEVFLAALRRMRQTEGQILLKPWLYEIAKNAVIDHWRRSRRAEEISYQGEGLLGPGDYDRLIASAPGPDDAVDTKHQLDNLRGAFGSLSDIHHEVLILRELEGRSYREIGERLGLTRPAVESTLFRARRRLTQEYDELASGRRCARIQGSIAVVARTGDLGSRDLNRMAKHLSHCGPCRRQAAALGVTDAVLAPRRRGMARVAAFITWPAVVLRSWVVPRRPGHSWSGTAQAARASQWSVGLAQTGDGLAAVWSKLVVSAMAVAALSMGVGLPDSGRRAAHVPVIAHPPALTSSIVAPVRQVVRIMWTPGHLGAGLRPRRWIKFGPRGSAVVQRPRSGGADPRIRPGTQAVRSSGDRARTRGASDGSQEPLDALPELYDSSRRSPGLVERVSGATSSAPSALERRGRSATGAIYSRASGPRRALSSAESAVQGAAGDTQRVATATAPGQPPPGPPPASPRQPRG